MEEKELKSTTVSIAGRSYPVRVEESKISVVQSAGKKINEQLRFFQSTYKDRDMQDCLAMALLTFAMDMEEKGDLNETHPMIDQLRKIDQILQKAMN